MKWTVDIEYDVLIVDEIWSLGVGGFGKSNERSEREVTRVHVDSKPDTCFFLIEECTKIGWA